MQHLMHCIGLAFDGIDYQYRVHGTATSTQVLSRYAWKVLHYSSVGLVLTDLPAPILASSSASFCSSRRISQFVHLPLYD